MPIQNDDSLFSRGDKSYQYKTFFTFILLTIASLLLVFVIWALSFKVSVYTTATGFIKHEDSNYKLDAQVDGVIAKVFVKNGQHVREGERLIQLYNEEEFNHFNANQFQLADYKANLYRLNAIINDKPLNFPQPLIDNYPTIIKNQTEQYQIEKEGVQEAYQLLKRNRDVSQAELDSIMPLIKKGVLAKIDGIKLESNISEIDAKMADVLNHYQLDAAKKRAELVTKIEALKETVKSSEHHIKHTEVVAPMAGVIYGLVSDKPGDVIDKGSDLLEIIPDTEGLTIVAQMSPQDVGMIKKDLPVLIHVDAYDYEIFGDLKGRVLDVSPDSLTNKDGSPYYSVIIRANDKMLHYQGREYKIKPGMSVTANIKVSQMSYLFYMLKPVTKIFIEGMTKW